MLAVLVSTLILLLSLNKSSGMLRHPLNRVLPAPSMERAKYSNDWAVEVNGGVTIANHLASKHGFINMGPVRKAIDRDSPWCMCWMSLVGVHVCGGR